MCLLADTLNQSLEQLRAMQHCFKQGNTQLQAAITSISHDLRTPLTAICGYLEKYPTLSFVLDVHRDAIEDKAGHQYKVITREDPSCAQISFVMGSNNDHWLENVKLAVAVQQRLTDTSPTLMRPMTLRNSNYNQHLTTGSMLVEIGTAGNSLSEALRAAQLFAMGLAQVVTEK